MRFVCRYCKCYWNLTVEPNQLLTIRNQVFEIQTEQCPTMLNGISHSLFGEIDGRVLDA
jgi:hypothetical protein